MAKKSVEIILHEEDQEYCKSTYSEDYVKKGIIRDLNRIDQQQELINDLMMEQLETA